MKTLKKEAVRFLIVGFTTVFIDYLVYRVLIGWGFDTSLSKGVSFFVGTVFSYFANKFFTFQVVRLSRSEPLRFGLVYFSTFVVNVAVHWRVMEVPPFLLQLELAWFVATACSTILNFVGMKFFVFQGRPATDSSSQQ